MTPPPRDPTTADGRVVLGQLQDAAPNGVSTVAMRDHGISRPMAAVYDLQLAGWPIERKGNRFWLRTAPAPEPPPPPPRVRRVVPIDPA